MTMSVIQTCFDSKDCLDLFRAQGLHLKPISRLNVSVQLPMLKKSGAKISNWEVMEKIKEMAKPFTFPVFKVSKSSLEFIRFEAEIENFGSLDQVLSKLDMKTIKLSGFVDLLKVRAAEAKPPFPTRNEWDDFFRENKNMNEMKPGERPDTIIVHNLPTKWFLNKQDRSGMSKDKPSEYVLKKIFGTYGEIRAVDVPMLDSYRDKMKSSIAGIQTFSFGQDLVFEAYIQYKEYIGFIKAMNSLKGMKLLYKDKYEDRCWVSNIKVDFDKTKHLAESTIKKRAQEREKLIQREREKEDTARRRSELEELKRSDTLRKIEETERREQEHRDAERKVKDARRIEREQRRRMRKKQTKFANEEEEMAHMIALEERKLVVAQRKLESIRLLDELLERVKAVKSKGSMKSIEEDLLKTAAKEAKGNIGKVAHNMLAHNYKDADEKSLRDKLVSKLKQKEVDKMEHFNVRLKNAKEGIFGDSDMESISDEELHDSPGAGKPGSGEDTVDDDSDSSGSDDDSGTEDPKEKKKKKKKLKKEKKRLKKEKKKEKREKEDKDRKKKRDIDNQISLATKIANKERRSRSREARRGERSSSRKEKSKEREQSYPDIRAQRIAERIARAQEERQMRKNLEKRAEKAQEEAYDRLMNPHLYGADDGRNRYRGIPNEHYENEQKREMEHELRVREREEQRLERERKARAERRHDRHDGYDRSRGGGQYRGGYDRDMRGGRDAYDGGRQYNHRQDDNYADRRRVQPYSQRDGRDREDRYSSRR